MAKSTRSKVKRSFRRDKRETAASAYHAAETARLARLSAKLRAKFEDVPTLTVDDVGADVKGVDESKGLGDAEQSIEMMEAVSNNDAAEATPKKISTSGARLSRRQEWRISKGMPVRPNRPSTLNKQGAPKARRKAGRSHRRR